MKSPNERKRKERAAKKAKGLTRLELWVKPEWHKVIKGYALELNNRPDWLKDK